MEMFKRMMALALLIGGFSLAGTALVGCDDGNDMDDVNDAFDDAGDNMEDAADDAKDNMDDAADNAGDAMQDATN